MVKVLAVAIGGAMGSVGRYMIAIMATKLTPLNFPLGTFIVNIIGSFLIGFCWSYFEKVHISNEFRLFIFAGFLGGFTTFSAFTRETIQFIKTNEPIHAISYVIASNVIGLTAVFLGFYISQKAFR